VRRLNNAEESSRLLSSNRMSTWSAMNTFFRRDPSREPSECRSGSTGAASQKLSRYYLNKTDRASDQLICDSIFVLYITSASCYSDDRDNILFKYRRR
jgi:hypothetical protein